MTAWKALATGLAFALLALVGPASAQAPAPAREAAAVADKADFPTFWTGFRALLLARDFEGAARYAARTVEQKGQLDGDRVRQLSGAAIAAEIARLMKAETGLAIGQTHEKLIAETRVPTARMVMTNIDARVGDLVFRKTGAGWRLTRTYRDQ